MPVGRAAVVQNIHEDKRDKQSVAEEEEVGAESLSASWSCHVTYVRWPLDFLLCEQTEPMWGSHYSQVCYVGAKQNLN